MVTLNTIEILTDRTTIGVYSKPYNGDWESLRRYREEFPNLYFRQWKNYETGKHFVYCWSIISDYTSIPNGFKKTIISSQDHPNVWCSILESSFVAFMKERGNNVFRRKYSHIWEMILEKDSSGFKGLGLIDEPVLQFSFHFLFSELSRKNNFFVSVQKGYAPKLTLSLEEYEKNNIDIRRWRKDSTERLLNNRENIKKLLLATGQSEKYLSYRNKIQAEHFEFESLEIFQKHFNKVSSLIKLPEELKITKFMLSNLPNSHFKELLIKTPQYYFHNEATGGGMFNDRIAKLKPSSYDQFKNKDVKILVITPQEHEGTVGSFSTDILNILKNTFHINNVSQELITFNPRRPYAYSDLLKGINVDDIDLVLQVVSKKDKEKEINRSPYYMFKAKLINQKTPSQKVLIETIRKDSSQTKEAIALNIYSKLGGTAWTIEKDQKDKAEIIIGISSTVDFFKKRVMGFASVLDYRGKFLTGECTQLSNLENYSKTLESHLTQMIKKIIQNKNIKPNEPFRLIFHLTKSAGKKNEIQAIENALTKFHEYQIQFGIVHLSYNHNYRMYADKGNASVKRGSFVRLSYNQALLHLGKPSKTPILVTRDIRSTYEDIEDMSKHILHFAHLSHRSYRPSSRPVTIQYPSIMAKLVSELNQVPDWDKSMIDKMNGKLWFI